MRVATTVTTLIPNKLHKTLKRTNFSLKMQHLNGYPSCLIRRLNNSGHPLY